MCVEALSNFTSAASDLVMLTDETEVALRPLLRQRLYLSDHKAIRAVRCYVTENKYVRIRERRTTCRTSSSSGSSDWFSASVPCGNKGL